MIIITESRISFAFAVVYFIRCITYISKLGTSGACLSRCPLPKHFPLPTQTRRRPTAVTSRARKYPPSRPPPSLLFLLCRPLHTPAAGPVQVSGTVAAAAAAVVVVRGREGEGAFFVHCCTALEWREGGGGEEGVCCNWARSRSGEKGKGRRGGVVSSCGGY